MDCVAPYGHVLVEVYDVRARAYIERQIVPNLVVTAGRNLLRDLLNGDTSAAKINYLAIGTASSSAAATDVGLGAEIFRDLLTQRTKDTAKLTSKYYLGTALLNGQTLRELTLCVTSSSGGTPIYARSVLSSPIAKTSAIAVTFTWDSTFSA
jgi:hypothetical protein